MPPVSPYYTLLYHTTPTIPYYPYYTLQPLLYHTTPTIPYNPYYTIQPLLYHTTPTIPYYPYYTLQPLLYLSTPTIPFNPYYTLQTLLYTTTPTIPYNPYYTLQPLLYPTTPTIPYNPYYTLQPLLYPTTRIVQAHTISQPFAYDEYKKSKIKEKIDEKRENRIQMAKVCCPASNAGNISLGNILPCLMFLNPSTKGMIIEAGTYRQITTVSTHYITCLTVNSFTDHTLSLNNSHR